MFPRRRRARSHASFVFWAALAAFDHAGNIMTNYISVHVMARQVKKIHTREAKGNTSARVAVAI
jgi:hypothetical protein